MPESMRPFDWKRDCPRDVERFRPIAGRGRGRELSPEAVQTATRKLQGRELTRRERPA
jgi:hypothetical protein